MAKSTENKAQENTPETLDMEALKAEILEELRAEMTAALKEELKAEVKAEIQKEKEQEAEMTAVAKSVPMTAEEIAYWDEKVSYHVPWIEGEEEEITIGHNGTLYKVKRGEEVKIPRKILDILLNAEKQKRSFAETKKGLKNQEIQA